MSPRQNVNVFSGSMARGSRDLERQQREREWKTQRTGIYFIVLSPHLSPTLNPQHSSLLLRHSPRGENAPPRIRYYRGYRRGQSKNGTGSAISTREGKRPNGKRRSGVFSSSSWEDGGVRIQVFFFSSLVVRGRSLNDVM